MIYFQFCQRNSNWTLICDQSQKNMWAKSKYKDENKKKSTQSARSAVCNLHGLCFGVTRIGATTGLIFSGKVHNLNKTNCVNLYVQN